MHSFKTLFGFKSFKRFLSFVLCVVMVSSVIPSFSKTVRAETGYNTGYKSGMAGDGYIRAHGLDVSAWQETGLDFQNIKNAGYDFVILRCGTSFGKDSCFEEYYANAKAAGLDVGCYFYSYALTGIESQKEACDVLTWIKGKLFEYPIYFDFEDPSQMDLSATASWNICRAFLDILKHNGYLAGVYSYSWLLSQSWVTTSGIRDTYEGWVAHVYSPADNTGITSGEYNIYKDRYCSVYGMHQYSYTTFVNGQGPFDANVAYKGYPSIVKTYGFNGYGRSWVEQNIFDYEVYRDRHDDLSHLSESELRLHWYNHGINEGRVISTFFDPKYYIENNPDLNLGNDYRAAYAHFVTNGYKEKRKSSPVFDGAYYCENNPDVVENYKDEYLLHYIQHGLEEGRRASENFDVDYYLYLRPVVANLWPGDLAKATRHYLCYGIREGYSGCDSELPVISNVIVSNVSENGYTVSCKVTDNWGVTNVSFPTWTVANGKDDLDDDFLNTQVGTKNGDTYTFTVKKTDHNNESGEYITHIYAEDKGGNVSEYVVNNVEVKDDAKITLSSSSNCVIKNKMLQSVDYSTTVNQLLSNFENKTMLKVFDNEGKELKGNALVGTGYTVGLYMNNKLVDSIKVVVLGDVDGNAILDSTDYLKIKSAFLEIVQLTEIEKIAADVDESKYIDSTDYMKIKTYMYYGK